VPAPAPHRPPPSREHAHFAALYRENVEFVWRSLRRLGTPDSQLDDATQDVFLVAARRMGEFEGRSAIKTWLFGIAMRVVKTHRRTRWRHERKLEALGHASASAGPNDPIARRDAQQTLLMLLDTLDDDRRAVYVLAELEGLTAVEIAEGLGLNVNTVYTRLRTARLALREAAERLEHRPGGNQP
jgi:RNA polymerase sigma-70 factor (ECF subfamily)